MHETNQMATRFTVVHATTYHYTEPIALCHNQLHLMPRATPRQTCLAHELAIWPTPTKVDETIDYFGNQISFFTVQEQHAEFSVTARSEVALVPSVYVAPEATPPWEQVAGSLQSPPNREALDASQFLYDSPLVVTDDCLLEYARASFPPERPWLEAVLDLTSRINRDFAYDQTATTVSTPLETVMAERRGVCQDFAHLQIGFLRAMGLSARYVSGYLLTVPPSGQPRLIGADASHAWLSAWCPGLGWVDLDPTNNVVPCLDHVTVAWGRDYSDVCPIKGVFVGGGHHSMTVSVDVRPLANGHPAE